jgi:hypothetical protein
VGTFPIVRPIEIHTKGNLHPNMLQYEVMYMYKNKKKLPSPNNIRKQDLPMDKVGCSIKRINNPSWFISQFCSTIGSSSFFPNELRNKSKRKFLRVTQPFVRRQYTHTELYSMNSLATGSGK